MKKYFYILLIITLFPKAELYAQSQQFIVKLVPFSSRTYDEFSPVFYKGGIVYCSNLRDNSLMGYNDGQNTLFKIFYVAPRDSTAWKFPKLFSKELTTDFNDGPVTFNEEGNIVYYSRNNSIGNYFKNASDTSNKLGIYCAELINGIWSNIQPFKFNNPLYTFSTPSLAPDGKRIYFSSDMQGGYGGMDLYYCEKKDESWDQPVNLGPVINTTENESFPFAYKYGKLYFASDGHKGFGGKDLFYTQEINGEWITPVHLDSAINSPADDFGIVIDSTFENGYFSTNRRKTDDIFSFKAAPIEFTSCDTILENSYCYSFYDERHQPNDSIPATYIWDFGDGIKRIGTEVIHCFPGPGDYTVKLNIFNTLTGDTISEPDQYNVKLADIEQAYINSYNVGIAEKPISFDGVNINLKDFRPTDYLWNFGDGFNAGAPLMNKVFQKSGEYQVKLGLLGEKDALGIVPKKCFMKKIRIYDSYQEIELNAERKNDASNIKTDSKGAEDKKLQIIIYSMDDLSARQRTKIEGTIKVSGEMTLNFNKKGILPDSYPLLDNIIEVLRENPDLNLELAVHAFENELTGEKMEISENWAQELEIYFRNHDIGMSTFHSKGFGLSPSVLKPIVQENKTIDGAIEFIFMKK